jgi:hypothetical protein
MGVDRHTTQDIVRVSGESGPNGEPIYKPLNDQFNQVRFVGSWLGNNGSDGPFCQMGSSIDPLNYLEVTFYGTGINILTQGAPGQGIYPLYLDGISQPDIDIGNKNDVIQQRNNASNVIHNVVSGEALGLHTIRITGKVGSVAGFGFYGFEVLNESLTDQLHIRPGTAFINGSKVRKATASNIDYTHPTLDVGWTNEYNTGSDTKGGKVLVYMDSDGAIHKDVTWTDSAQKDLALADHSNEEKISEHFWREFGAGRDDDLSTLGGSTIQDRIFSLDDGTTSLITDNMGNSSEFLRYAGLDPHQLQVTFIGTGFGIYKNDQATGVDNTHTVSIDGQTPIAFEPNGDTSNKLFKIVSGLPYGTHTIKFLNTGLTAFNRRFGKMLIYGPKKPTLPEDCIELASYNLMADYVAIPTAGLESIPTGSIRKYAGREIVYTGTGWDDVNIPNLGQVGGWDIRTANLTDYLEYTFWGTGIGLMFDTGAAANVTIAIDGNPDLSSFTLDLKSSGGSIPDPSTGVFTGDATPGDSLVITGLTLGKHTIKATLNASSLIFSALEVITPIHTPKLNGPFIKQNTLRIGSQSVGDNRAFSILKIPTKKVSAVAIGVSVSPNTTSSADYIPANEMASTIQVETDGAYQLSFFAKSINDANEDTFTTLHIDGVEYPVATRIGMGTSISQRSHYISALVYLTEGTHYIQGSFKTSGGGNAILVDGDRQLTITKVD